MRLERFGDRAAIADQMFRYARATGWLETQRHREVFVDDCVFASPHSGDIHGVDAVVAWMDRALAKFEATQHLIGNSAIDFSGPGTATAVSYVRAWHHPRDHSRPDMVLWGEYHDRWVSIDGCWRIQERRGARGGDRTTARGWRTQPRGGVS